MGRFWWFIESFKQCLNRQCPGERTGERPWAAYRYNFLQGKVLGLGKSKAVIEVGGKSRGGLSRE